MNVALGNGSSAGAPVPNRMRYVKARIVVLALLLVAFAGAIVHKAYDLQVRQAAKLRAMAEEQYLRDIRLTPKRGTIYDRSGAELAVSVDVDSVSPDTSTANHLSPFSTTVRQQPAWLTEAPRSMDDTS